MGQRLDKWLVYARLAKHRSTAASLIEEGHIRLNRERVQKCSQSVKPDDVLTIAVGGDVKVIKVLGEAERRKSATLAGQLYEDLTRVEKADATKETLC